MSDFKEKSVLGMCNTWRHDFELEKRTNTLGSCGTTADERAYLIQRMSQLYDHHVAPYVAEAERLEGIETAYETACNVRNRLILENQALQKDAESGRLLRLLSGAKAERFVDAHAELVADVRRLKLLAGEPVPPTYEEFVGPHPETVNGRLRRKLAEMKGAGQ